ncbi:DUF6907 domain-containing protein [Microlunatus capsulatus]|uniref:Uncharacterized protein n=1 Tax=Microlunatus capsulatus TaxID=99117 RepID=A0ABS4ZDA2_9ACTN|nr:hypothetical protein [Microlunatus capsulatus]MBP2419012.1 hypothetical protein [Microlunatus capsulatus]
MTTNTDPALLPCPPWCLHDGIVDDGHSWTTETADGSPERHHLIECSPVVAESDGLDRHGSLPSAEVGLVQAEWSGRTAVERGPLRITLCTESYPHFTPEEARKVAQQLLAMAARAEAVA